MKLDGPCLNCKNRNPPCWGSCEEYKAWRTEFDKIKNKRKQRIEFDDAVYTIHGGRMKR